MYFGFENSQTRTIKVSRFCFGAKTLLNRDWLQSVGGDVGCDDVHDDGDGDGDGDDDDVHDDDNGDSDDDEKGRHV